ncbi:MAG: hypothetical protein WBM71_14185, partial [Sedimenticolaceae bacterium]
MSIIEKAVDKMMGKLETPAPAKHPHDETKTEVTSREAAAETAQTVAEPVVGAQTDVAPPPEARVEPETTTEATAPARKYDVEQSPVESFEAAGNLLKIKALGLEGILSPDSERS